MKRILMSVLITSIIVFSNSFLSNTYADKEWDCEITIDESKHDFFNRAFPTDGCVSSVVTGYWNNDGPQIMGSVTRSVSNGEIVTLSGNDKLYVTVIPKKEESKPDPEPEEPKDPKPDPKPDPEKPKDPKPNPKPGKPDKPKDPNPNPKPDKSKDEKLQDKPNKDSPKKDKSKDQGNRNKTSTKTNLESRNHKNNKEDIAKKSSSKPKHENKTNEKTGRKVEGDSDRNNESNKNNDNNESYMDNEEVELTKEKDDRDDKQENSNKSDKDKSNTIWYIGIGIFVVAIIIGVVYYLKQWKSE